ncbi:MAG: hypothetical protein EP343_28620 [Deltaproteobacteria bacterium]|nr:MAG: hypothetical protein EP343_28620 [Deltaproteobacteria bacterium]
MSCSSPALGPGESCSAESLCMPGLSCINGTCQVRSSEEDSPEPVVEPPNDGSVAPEVTPEPVLDMLSERREPAPERTLEPAPEPAPEPVLEKVPEVRPETPVEELDPTEKPPGQNGLTLLVQAVQVSHDDGSRAASITPAQVKQWVDEANKVFAVAKITFQFDPSKDFSQHKSTLLNRINSASDPDWQQAVNEGNKVALSHPGKMTVFFRYGRGSQPTGGGFSWTNYDFVVMPGFDKTFVCGHQNITLFAHEVGHYLGLHHTFKNIYNTVAEAKQAWDNSAQDPNVFDGDGLDDTSPDAYNHELQCSSALSMTLSGTTFPIPRHNIMSYHDSAQKTLSPDQVDVIRQVAWLRLGNELKGLVNATIQIEGETLASVASGDGNVAAQHQMRNFHGRWSQNSQLWWSGAVPPGKLSAPFSMTIPGTYRVYAVFTQAPDFGKHSLQINGQSAGTIDLYARLVRHTKPIDLGVHTLQTQNTLQFTVQGKHTSSRSYGLGLDALLFKPVP